jgi:hypothetical protein
MKYPSVHGGSGFASQHRTTEDNEPNRISGELSDWRWRSYADASDPVPPVWHPYFILDFWVNRCRFYRDFYSSILRPSSSV